MYDYILNTKAQLIRALQREIDQLIMLTCKLTEYSLHASTLGYWQDQWLKPDVPGQFLSHHWDQ